MNDDNLLSDLRTIALKNQYEAAEIGKRAADRIEDFNKERDERSKGCEACKAVDGPSLNYFADRKVFLTKTNGEPVIVSTSTQVINITFCPNCGRELKED